MKNIKLVLKDSSWTNTHLICLEHQQRIAFLNIVTRCNFELQVAYKMFSEQKRDQKLVSPDPGEVFTTNHFLYNLQMCTIS
jgi:hypothetical protein